MKKTLLTVFVCAVLMGCGSDTRLFQQAKLATSKGNYQKALSLYNQLIKQNPDHAPALTNRALIWEMLPAKNEAEKAKNRRFAKQDYLRSLEVNPNQPETYNNLGALYMDQNQNREAIQYFSEAIARQPNYFRALLNRATAYSKIGDLTSALQDFAIAATQRPHDPALLFNRGLAYFSAGKYEAAIDDFSHALAVQPQNARLYVERARAFVKYGYPAEAYDDLTQAIALNPQDGLAYYYVADLMYRNGDKDFALGALVKTKEVTPNYVPAYDLMGDMLAVEDPVSATANYMVAEKLDPKNAAKYQRKIQLMKSEEGRYRVQTERFYPQGRSYNSLGQRFVASPIPTGVQTTHRGHASAWR